MVHIWEDDGWDEKSGTVLPETVTKYAIEAAETYPKKRLVVHYMQPHYPFVYGDAEFGRDHLQKRDPDEANPWYKKLYGELDITRDRLWTAYVENLKGALPHVKKFLSQTKGRTIVTADHGNMFGEQSFPIPIREWGHPHTTFTEELVKVPWLVVEDGSRREIVPEESNASPDVDSNVSDRLQQLGYRS
ncbi:alkaline phosphatase family protein [Halopenitus persicus]|uniref:hypothetical protein n=1 Tax=Halopenitus persicus TaxID=1048396 RepID=UPI0018EE8BBC|nr:hypothetical protein [Halopenitus persicus]